MINLYRIRYFTHYKSAHAAWLEWQHHFVHPNWKEFLVLLQTPWSCPDLTILISNCWLLSWHCPRLSPCPNVGIWRHRPTSLPWQPISRAFLPQTRWVLQLSHRRDVPLWASFCRCERAFERVGPRLKEPDSPLVLSERTNGMQIMSQKLVDEMKKKWYQKGTHLWMGS